MSGEEPSKGNLYNQNFRNRFCGCGELYDAHQQKGTMFQCIGLATEEQGGCGEDWWHPECLMGLPRDWHIKDEAKEKGAGAQQDLTHIGEKDETQNAEAGPPVEKQDVEEEEHPVPPGFPDEEDFDTLICYKCVAANPWIKKYAQSEGFRTLAYHAEEKPSEVIKTTVKANDSTTEATPETLQNGNSKKRKAEDDDTGVVSVDTKKAKVEDEAGAGSEAMPLHTKLFTAPEGRYSIMAINDDFRSKFCRCAECYPNLSKHPQLLEEEDTYEPPLSDNGKADGSVGTGSLLERGEAALSNVDRVRAIGKLAC